ncbi:MAG: hypothetical protein U0936_13025 [Planctomycetaceae bacterium]
MRSLCTGVVVDDSEAQFDGEWVGSSFLRPFSARVIVIPVRLDWGFSATYEAMLPEDGEYVVRVVINHAESRSDKVPVVISHADGGLCRTPISESSRTVTVFCGTGTIPL